MTLRNGIIDGFEPGFKSISKDCNRYFDALVDLNEKGVVETGDVIELNAQGSLWISRQYIEKGLLDLVEKDLIRDVADRNFYGALFENTQKVMDYLLEASADGRVVAIYKAAINHRFKAAKSEASIMNKHKPGSHANGASSKWLKHYLPALQNIIGDYESLLKQTKQDDPELKSIRDAVKELKQSL